MMVQCFECMFIIRKLLLYNSLRLQNDDQKIKGNTIIKRLIKQYNLADKENTVKLGVFYKEI